MHLSSPVILYVPLCIHQPGYRACWSGNETVYLSQFHSSRSLALHRKTVLEEDKTLNHSKSSPPKSPSSNVTSTQNSSPSISNNSPRTRRRAPPPPTQVEAKASSPKHSTSSNGTEVARKDSKTDNRLSLQVETSNFIGDPRPRFGSLPRRTAPPPPSKTDPGGSPPKAGSSPAKTSKDGFSTLPIGKPPKHPSSSDIVDTSSFTTFSTFKSSPQSSHSRLQVKKSPLTDRRYSEDAGRLQKQSSTSLSSSGPIRRARSGSIDSPESQRRIQSSSSPGTPRRQSTSTGNSPKSPRKYSFSGGPSPGGSPQRQRSSEGDVFHHIPLPTSFSSKDGAELVEIVRTR